MESMTSISRIELPDGQHTLIERLESHVGLLTIRELAILMRRNRKTIYAMVRDGLIPRFNDGSDKLLVDPKTYAEFLRAMNPLMVKASRPRSFRQTA